MNIILINYGLLNSNSGGHVAHFANECAHLGSSVFVIGDGDPASVEDYGKAKFTVLPRPKNNSQLPKELLAIANRDDCIIHAWTPRTIVRELVEALHAKTKCPYVVHLEDNELSLLASHLNQSEDEIEQMSLEHLDIVVPNFLSHPKRAFEFMRNSIGVTVIIDKLAEHVPAGVPVHLLEPGVDTTCFAPLLNTSHRAKLRADLGITPETKVFAYHGNMHFANYEDIFSLYTAMMILTRRGHNVLLLRMGKNSVENVDPSFEYLNAGPIKEFGFQPRSRMVELLQLADFFVQPGRSNKFNDYRLPSKLPEFFALGRPVALPKTNVGLRVVDQQNAVVLTRGDGLDIATGIEPLLYSEAIADDIGRQGREFAKDHFDWSRNAQKLESFYREQIKENARKK